MKKAFLISFMTLVSIMASSQTKVFLTIGGNTLTATLADNDATHELKGLLEKSDITIQMNDYGGFEKVGALPFSLPTSNTQITTEPGDIMLYQGNQMVIFYGTNSWSYTRLGKIDGASANDLKQILGNGNIALTLSLDPDAGIEELSTDRNNEDVIYDINGKRMTKKTLQSGIYVVNGKTTRLKQM